MRTRLLVLLSFVVLLLQPMTLLHGLTHAHADGAGAVTVAAPDRASTAEAADTADTAEAVEAACSLCLGLGALGLGLWPASLRLPAPAEAAAPSLAARPVGQGGTAAGYHARGPPASLH